MSFSMSSLHFIASLILVLSCHLSLTLAGILDRSGEPRYRVDIEPRYEQWGPLLDDPLVHTEEITDYRGIRYRCQIPRMEKNDDDEASEVNDDPNQDVLPFLEDLRDPCLYRLEGWWSYEFCFGKHVKQFHAEKEAPSNNVEYFLGQADPSAKTSRTANSFSEYYTNGAMCDLTNTPRTVEVRYICDPMSNAHKIHDLQEPSTCTYLLIVATPSMCRHPAYKPNVTPVQPLACRRLESDPRDEEEVTFTIELVDGSQDEEVQNLLQAVQEQIIAKHLQKQKQPGQEGAVDNDEVEADLLQSLGDVKVEDMTKILQAVREQLLARQTGEKAKGDLEDEGEDEDEDDEDGFLDLNAQRVVKEKTSEEDTVSVGQTEGEKEGVAEDEDEGTRTSYRTLAIHDDDTEKDEL